MNNMASIIHILSSLYILRITLSSLNHALLIMCITRHSFKISHVWGSLNIVHAIEIHLLTILHIHGHLESSRDQSKYI